MLKFTRTGLRDVSREPRSRSVQHRIEAAQSEERTVASIEELQQELGRLREDMAAMRAQVALTPTLIGDAHEPRRVLSRRNLLRAAPIAALGGALATMVASPAAAATGDPLLLGESNAADTHPDGTVDVTSMTTPLTLDTLVVAPATSYTGDPGAAVIINAPVTGYHPFGQDGLAVTTTDGGVGITVTSGDGVGYDDPAGVQGIAISASVVAGQVMVAETTSTTSAHDAVTLTHAGTSRAVYAQSTLATNINGTITGVNEGAGIGVWGEHRNTAVPGIGVVGVGSTYGRGAQLSGGAAAVRLVPSAGTSHPRGGQVGDLYVDSTARLWFCQKSSTAILSAIWKQIA